MDKQELIHTHALLAEIRTFTADDANTPEYDALDVAPIALTATAKDHEVAVLTLAGELATSLSTDAPRRAAPLAAD